MGIQCLSNSFFKKLSNNQCGRHPYIKSKREIIYLRSLSLYRLRSVMRLSPRSAPSALYRRQAIPMPWFATTELERSVMIKTQLS